MVLMALGVNYLTAPIQIREKLAFNFEMGAKAARLLVESGVVSEAVLVSTCHRTELYCEGMDGLLAMQALIRHCGLDYSSIAPYTYVHSNLTAVKHLMRVACGLDSMILGEGEILGQIKKAYTAAANIGCLGRTIGRLFQNTFTVAKKVRTHTGIGINPVSIAYAAARLSQHIFSDLGKTVVLLVGAGDLIRLTAEHLMGMGVQKIIVANRTEINAKRLASELGGESIRLEQIPERLASADMVITGTNSPTVILSKEMVQDAIYKRKRRPIFMVDLSMPRDIESSVGNFEDVYLYCIDDLRAIVEENLRVRGTAVRDAEEIISIAAGQFMSWHQSQEHFKLITVFRQKFEDIRDQLLQDSVRLLALGEKPEEVLHKFAHRLTNRFLHEPTCRIRMAGMDKEKTLLALTRDLFELNHEIIDTK